MQGRYKTTWKKEIQTFMAQGRSTKIISMIKWIRTSRLSINNSLPGARALARKGRVGKGEGIPKGRVGGPAPRLQAGESGECLAFMVYGGEFRVYRGTSLIRKRRPLGPYSSHVPWALRRSWGVGVFSWARYPCTDASVVRRRSVGGAGSTPSTFQLPRARAHQYQSGELKQTETKGVPRS